MKNPLRSLIAFTAIALMWPGAPAHSRVPDSSAHRAASSAGLSGTGFLDFKSFLIGPGSSDDIALTSERMRLVSPGTLRFERAGGIENTPSQLPDFLSSLLAPKPEPNRNPDSVTIEVNGTPVSLSLGLREAVLRDLQENIRLYGVPALFDPMPGPATAALIGRAADDIIRRIDALQGAVSEPGFRYDPASTVSSGTLAAEPSSLVLFAFGLLVMGWLRRRA